MNGCGFRCLLLLEVIEIGVEFKIWSCIILGELYYFLGNLMNILNNLRYFLKKFLNFFN